MHIQCATKQDDQLKRSIDPVTMNKAVDPTSPLWAGMTPLLIAAKFHNMPLVRWLIKQKASPAGRDSKGNTPLHFLHVSSYYNENLFLHDDSTDKTGAFNGMNHFHIACL